LPYNPFPEGFKRADPLEQSEYRDTCFTTLFDLDDEEEEVLQNLSIPIK
jgi:hypothetical protein